MKGRRRGQAERGNCSPRALASLEFLFCLGLGSDQSQCVEVSYYTEEPRELVHIHARVLSNMDGTRGFKKPSSLKFDQLDCNNTVAAPCTRFASRSYSSWLIFLSIALLGLQPCDSLSNKRSFSLRCSVVKANCIPRIHVGGLLSLRGGADEAQETQSIQMPLLRNLLDFSTSLTNSSEPRNNTLDPERLAFLNSALKSLVENTTNVFRDAIADLALPDENAENIQRIEIALDTICERCHKNIANRPCLPMDEFLS
jgi:hypothetical protein